MNVTFRPLPVWLHPATDPGDRRGRSTFTAGWQNTMDLLAREIGMLEGRSILIGGAFREEDIRLDGMPRAGAREPSHPGIEISFDSLHGRLVYATDVCAYWQHNVRSIALGLESLRAVDRYGVSRHGEQYAGWLRLTAGGGTDVERGRVLVERAGGIIQALKAHHPDQGGDGRDFADVRAYQKGQA